MGWDRPTPFAIYKIKKREGWDAGWSLGHRVLGSCSVVVRPAFQMGCVLTLYIKIHAPHHVYQNLRNAYNLNQLLVTV
jgi:hypothetical protein